MISVQSNPKTYLCLVSPIFWRQQDKLNLLCSLMVSSNLYRCCALTNACFRWAGGFNRANLTLLQPFTAYLPYKLFTLHPNLRTHSPPSVPLPLTVGCLVWSQWVRMCLVLQWLEFSFTFRLCRHENNVQNLY